MLVSQKTMLVSKKWCQPTNWRAAQILGCSYFCRYAYIFESFLHNLIECIVKFVKAQSMFLMAIFLKKILILVQGISWKRCPQLPVPPRIDSLHWMSVRSKYLLYEIRDINKLFFFFLWSVSFKYNFLKYYAIHMCVPYSWLIYNSALF